MGPSPLKNALFLHLYSFQLCIIFHNLLVFWLFFLLQPRHLPQCLLLKSGSTLRKTLSLRCDLEACSFLLLWSEELLLFWQGMSNKEIESQHSYCCVYIPQCLLSKSGSKWEGINSCQWRKDTMIGTKNFLTSLTTWDNELPVLWKTSSQGNKAEQ